MFCIVTPIPADRWQHDCCSYVSTHLRFDHAIKITIVDNYAQLSTIGAVAVGAWWRRGVRFAEGKANAAPPPGDTRPTQQRPADILACYAAAN